MSIFRPGFATTDSVWRRRAGPMRIMGMQRFGIVRVD
jgi:hypothetical protein